MFTTKQNWGNISVISPLSQSNAVKARLKLFKHHLGYTFEFVYTWIWAGQGKEIVSWKGRKVSPETCFKGWMGRKGIQEYRCFLGTFILAKTKVSDNRQVRNENLNIKYTQIHVMVFAFYDVRVLYIIRVRSLSRCHKNNTISVASIIVYRLNHL